MMFWETYQSLCKENSLASANVLNTLGLSTSMTTNWKNGRLPGAEILCKLADYFDVTVDYLLGRSKTKKPVEINEPNLSDSEKLIITALRKHSPEKRLSLEHKMFAVLLEDSGNES